MADKLICPFCGGELYSSDNCYVCLNDDCIFCGFHFMEKRWKPIIELKQALIQAKQDLEIVVDALKSAKKRFELINNSKFANLNNVLQIQSQCEILKINQALEQIEHKE